MSVPPEPEFPDDDDQEGSSSEHKETQGNAPQESPALSNKNSQDGNLSGPEQQGFDDDVFQLEVKLSEVEIEKTLGELGKNGIDDKGCELLVEESGKKEKPIYNANISFEELNLLDEPLLDGLADASWVNPSRIQSCALPIILRDSHPNLVAQAHHGSGKTGAFVLAMLSRIDFEVQKLQCIVLCHSRELSRQTAKVAVSLGQYIANLKVVVAVRESKLPEPWVAHICVGTPGTILHRVINPALFSEFGEKSLVEFLSHFKIFVIDEADEFLKQNVVNVQMMNTMSRRGRGWRGWRGRGRGRGGSRNFANCLFPQLNEIIANLKTHVKKNIQWLLFSATFPKKVRHLAVGVAKDAVLLTLQRKELQLVNIALYRVKCKDENDKFQVLLRTLTMANVGQVIIFVNSIKRAKFLIQALQSKEIGIRCSALYGAGMKAVQRDETMTAFKQGETTCLVASNVIARGIDVPAVKLVVNFEIPFNIAQLDHACGKTWDSETFMHRVGRTGRFGAQGVCLNLVDDELSITHLQGIQKEYNLKIEDFDSSDITKIHQKASEWLGEEQEIQDQLKKLSET